MGIDARKAELQVALLRAPDTVELVAWTVRKEARTVDRLRRKLETVAPGPIAGCYGAGRCGYALQRQLDRGRARCEAIAPALVPRKPGERIKTDRRDARTLAGEAVRDLCRARDDARVDRQRSARSAGSSPARAAATAGSPMPAPTPVDKSGHVIAPGTPTAGGNAGRPRRYLPSPLLSPAPSAAQFTVHLQVGDESSISVEDQTVTPLTRRQFQRAPAE